MVYQASHCGIMKQHVRKAWIPKFDDSVIVSMNVPWSGGEKITDFCNAREHGIKECKADFIMADPRIQAPVVNMPGVVYTGVTGEMGDMSGMGAGGEPAGCAGYDQGRGSGAQSERKGHGIGPGQVV